MTTCPREMLPYRTKVVLRRRKRIKRARVGVAEALTQDKADGGLVSRMPSEGTQCYLGREKKGPLQRGLLSPTTVLPGAKRGRSLAADKEGRARDR